MSSDQARPDPTVRRYMTTPLFSASPGDSLSRIHALLARRRIASLPVVEQERLVGVITRHDLVSASRRHASNTADPVLAFPDLRVRDVMSLTPVTIELDAPMSVAAGRLLAHHVHCLYVVEDGVPVGVLSPRGFVRAIVDARPDARVEAIMSSPVLAVRGTTTVAAAVDQLATERVRGLIVVDDDDNPVGIFTQVEALTAAAQARPACVSELMEPVGCVAARTTLHAAASRFLGLGVRGILVAHRREFAGIVTAVDFARHLASLAR